MCKRVTTTVKSGQHYTVYDSIWKDKKQLSHCHHRAKMSQDNKNVLLVSVCCSLLVAPSRHSIGINLWNIESHSFLNSNVQFLHISSIFFFLRKSACGRLQTTFQVRISGSRTKEWTWIFSSVFTPALQFLWVQSMNTCWHVSTSKERPTWLWSSAPPLKYAMRHETFSLSKMTSGEVQLTGFLRIPSFLLCSSW